MRKDTLLCLAIGAMLAVACRHDDYIIYSQSQDTGRPTTKGSIAGMYVLNEGNMGSNKASVDYLDLSASTGTVVYTRNIYPERNPNTVKELGDVGNDIQIYGSKMWMVINASNKVEVATADSCRRIGQINIPNCRYVVFDKGFAYITSYVSPISIDPNARRGMVYKVDTLTLQKTDSLVVGYQPEEMCIVENKLYVANSGGYRAPNYDRTVSEIDLNTFAEIRKIDVAINLHRCRADQYGQIWVSSRGDYNDIPSRLYLLGYGSDGSVQVKQRIDVPVSDFCIVDNKLYFYGTQWNSATLQSTIEYGIIDVRTHRILTRTLSASPEINKIKMPYGIIVNPVHGDFYLMDAKNYVSSGELLHFLADGTFDYKVLTGDIPSRAAFVYKK